MPKSNNHLPTQYGFLAEKDRSFPSMVVVEITNLCNLQCIHCPYTIISKKENFRPRHMDWDLYKKIVHEVAQHKGIIFRILSDGEPTVHPQFYDMLTFAKENNINPLNFITNGLLLDESKAKKVLNTGVEIVEFSLDALHKETYDKIRVGSNYNVVMRNVHNFIRLRNEMKAKTKIFVSIIMQKESEHEYEDFVAYWTPKVDKVISRVYTSIHGLVNTKKLTHEYERARWPCPQLWRRLFINVDGFAEFCVEDWTDETIMGNVNKTSISEIWTSKEYAELRMHHLDGNFEKIPYCADCPDWQTREWDNNYFRAVKEVLSGGDPASRGGEQC